MSDPLQTGELNTKTAPETAGARAGTDAGTQTGTQANAYAKAGSAPGEFDRTIYRVARKPRLLNGKFFAAFLAGILLAILGVGAWYVSLGYSIDQLSDAARKAEKTLIKTNAKEGEPVDIADSLRESTVEKIVADQTIPAYTYNQCWNLDVSKPSGVTLADLQLVSRGAFVGIEDAFLKAEQDYGINCLFVMGIASLESANGTICFRPNNMFGFGGRGFSSKSECVDVVARALEYNYLTPGGSLYNGTRITDVNKRYAASSTWDNKVCRNMARYYSIIAPAHNARLQQLQE